MTATIQEINSSIMFGNLTNDQLDSVLMAVKYARSQLGKEKIRSITKGATVKFTSSRNGQTYQGSVEKVALKYVTVRTHVGLYKVPANMLEVV